MTTTPKPTLYPDCTCKAKWSGENIPGEIEHETFCAWSPKPTSYPGNENAFSESKPTLDERKFREFDLYYQLDDDGTISPYDISICQNNELWTPNSNWAEPTVHVIEYAAIVEMQGQHQDVCVQLNLRIAELHGKIADMQEENARLQKLFDDAYVLLRTRDAEIDAVRSDRRLLDDCNIKLNQENQKLRQALENIKIGNFDNHDPVCECNIYASKALERK